MSCDQQRDTVVTTKLVNGRARMVGQLFHQVRNLIHRINQIYKRMIFLIPVFSELAIRVGVHQDPTCFNCTGYTNCDCDNKGFYF